MDQSDNEPPCLGGITEWSCGQGRKVLSLAWDWKRIDDGAIVVDGVQGVRTNMMLTCEKGYDLGSDATAAELLERIARLPWQTEVATALRSSNVFKRSSVGESTSPMGMSRH